MSNAAIQATPLEQWSYSPDGLRASLTDANGHATDYAYDGFDRLATATWPDASTETYTYDGDGNRLSRKTRKGDTIAFTYDTLNRLATKAAPGEAMVSYAYDLGNHLIGVSDTSAAIAAPATAARYAASYTYDARNRLIGASFSPAPAQVPPTASSVAFTYRYNGANQRIGQSVSDASWLFYPTGATAVSYTANSLNQYSAIGSVAPTYDSDGNLTSDGTYSYAYDAENHLTGISEGTNAVASYAYDAEGRRKSKSAGGTTTIYVTDADSRTILEYDGASGALKAWTAYGLGSNAVLDQMNPGAGTRETLIPDVQGSIVGLLDSGTGALTRIGYESFGEHPGLTSGGYRYTAQRFDPETAGSAAEPSGLYDYRARIYSPTLGRFLQPDPAGYTAGTNLYEYTGNDPVNNTDPSGNIALVDNLIGAGVGVGVDLVAQYAQARVAGLPFQIDWTRTAVAAGAGFLTSGASAFLEEGASSVGLGAASSFALRAAGNTAIGSAVSVGSTATLNGLEGTNDSLTTAAIAGGGFSAIGSALAEAVPAISSAINQSEIGQLGPCEQNMLTGIANLSGYKLGGPSPAAVAAGQQVGNFAGSLTSFSGGSEESTSNPSAK